MFPPNTQETRLLNVEAFKRTKLSSGHFVRAASILNIHSTSEFVDIKKLCQKSTSIPQCIEIIETEGRLYCLNSHTSTSSWLKIISFAKDCQSCNILLTATEEGITLKVIKNIIPGEPLLMWFTETILAIVDMPFLTPINIEGQNRYICHMCHSLFEHPNPLKIHLILKCNLLERDHLWNILAKEYASKITSTLAFSLVHKKFKFELTPSSSTETSPNLAHQQSAFKPYVKQPSPASTVSFKSDVNASEMETFISNLGRSNRGYVCIYCKKIYSRKYGLKIHIRTHTGYKPLRCKFCQRPFGDPSNLNKHIRLHTDENPYRCDICDKVLVRRRDLERHMRTRHESNVKSSSNSSTTR